MVIDNHENGPKPMSSVASWHFNKGLVLVCNPGLSYVATVSRTFIKVRKDGLIDMCKAGDVAIRDRAALTFVADGS